MAARRPSTRRSDPLDRASDMTVRELPGWPPTWTSSSSPAPRGEVGVLRTLEWRVDLTGTRDLRIAIEYRGGLWTALYPGSSEVRGRFNALGGGVTLDSVYQT